MTHQPTNAELMSIYAHRHVRGEMNAEELWMESTRSLRVFIKNLKAESLNQSATTSNEVLKLQEQLQRERDDYQSKLDAQATRITELQAEVERLMECINSEQDAVEEPEVPEHPWDAIPIMDLGRMKDKPMSSSFTEECRKIEIETDAQQLLEGWSKAVKHNGKEYSISSKDYEARTGNRLNYWRKVKAGDKYILRDGNPIYRINPNWKQGSKSTTLNNFAKGQGLKIKNNKVYYISISSTGKKTERPIDCGSINWHTGSGRYSIV